ncbi:MAG: hypothetical protein IKB64_03180 [Paludibacteraceae bacterium]|nr:hypothetical protein [Paludibacteraceae bacterium]
MTIAELERLLRSKNRVRKRELQEKATLDYTLADLIGKSVSRIYNANNTMPEIEEVYPTLFDSKELQIKRQEKQAELSAIRFKLFADSFNKSFKEQRKKEQSKEE